MDIFRPLLEQLSRTRFAIIIRKHIYLLIIDSIGGDPSKQLLHNRTHDAILCPTFLPGPNIPSAVSASENSTPLSAPEIHYLL